MPSVKMTAAAAMATRGFKSMIPNLPIIRATRRCGSISDDEIPFCKIDPAARVPYDDKEVRPRGHRNVLRKIEGDLHPELVLAALSSAFIGSRVPRGRSSVDE